MCSLSCLRCPFVKENQDVDVVTSLVRKHGVVWQLWQECLKNSPTWRSIPFRILFCSPSRLPFQRKNLWPVSGRTGTHISLPLFTSFPMWKWISKASQIIHVTFLTWHASHNVSSCQPLVCLYRSSDHSLHFHSRQFVWTKWCEVLGLPAQPGPPTFNAIIHWVTCHVQAGRQMEWLAFYIAFLFDSMSFCRPPYEHTAVIWNNKVIPRPEAHQSWFCLHVPNDMSFPLIASWGCRLDVMPISHLARYI